MPRPSKRMSLAAAPQMSPMKIPLNDDNQEKTAKRRQDLQRESMRASVTPSMRSSVAPSMRTSVAPSMRASATPGRRRTLLVQQLGSPHTPSNNQDDIPDVSGTAVTPMRRPVPLLANFEEWMKMATDNKINATNSWNFALIDYFHDMSLLKEGDGVNFQKASCTLDGCVKIYTSRVDSVATDTGKLLSGLAESGNKKRRGEAAEGEDDDEDAEEDEDGQKKQKKKRAARSAEATLATSFAQLQNKKMELELSVDPLFKKASADFDEGGAKGLLLNHLAIDSRGRIVFDSSDDANDATPAYARATPAPEELAEDDENEEPEASDDVEIDIAGITAKYFPILARLDEQDICPSMKTFELGNAEGSMDLPFLKAPEDGQDKNRDNGEEDEAGNRSGLYLDDDNALGFDDDDNVNMGGFDLPVETGFGEGGEVWAQEVARDPQARVHTIGMGEGDREGSEEGAIENQQYDPATAHGRNDEQENILAYFDNSLKKNWAGPEHWRIRRVKEAGKTPQPTKRKEKEPFKLDFAAPMSQSLADMVYTRAATKSAITLPRAQWTSKDRNLLPLDMGFNSKQLLRLFLKPKARMESRRAGRRGEQQQVEGEVEEAYWASRENDVKNEDDDVQGNYDADFFQDAPLPMAGVPLDDEGETFADARDHFSPPPDDGPLPMSSMEGAAVDTGEGAFGTQLVTQSRRLRPEYVQFARVAKKVDVKRLKDELWKGIGFEDNNATPAPESSIDATPKSTDDTLKFTSVMSGLQGVYPKQAMADISTSYCFICLLHLANEKGLVINNQEGFEDLSIRKDFTADLSVGI